MSLPGATIQPMDTHPTRLRCELCGATDFDPLYLPGTAVATGLWACRQCRLVYGPRPPAPGGRAGEPAPPDLARYGPSIAR